MTRDAHPVADLFPMLADDELEELAEDIRQRGLIQPIVLDPQGRVLDGRNRLAACELAGVEPRFETYEGDDPDGYALAVNIARRHLRPSQRYMLIEKARRMTGPARRRRCRSEEHLANHRNADGSYDLDAAEEDRRYELESDPAEVVKLAAKIAKQERIAWQAKETMNLRKQFAQPALSPELDLELKVPIGDSTVVEYGAMNHDRIRLRKDMRLKVHLDELRAFDIEMTHWLHTEPLLHDGETINDALQRGDQA